MKKLAIHNQLTRARALKGVIDIMITDIHNHLAFKESRHRAAYNDAMGSLSIARSYVETAILDLTKRGIEI